LSSYVASHCLAVFLHSGAKQNYYCTVYYTTLNSNDEAQKAPKNLEKNCRRSQKPKFMQEGFECNFFTFDRKTLVLKVTK
jgi:hypothetical protein